jgi:hypothetical protein
MSLEIALFMSRVQNDYSNIKRGVVGELIVLFDFILSVIRRKADSGVYTIAVSNILKRLH